MKILELTKCLDDCVGCSQRIRFALIILVISVLAATLHCACFFKIYTFFFQVLNSLVATLANKASNFCDFALGMFPVLADVYPTEFMDIFPQMLKEMFLYSQH